MKKEKKVRTYQRRTKTGKLVTVKQHTAKYDAAEKAKEMLKKKGAGDELSAKKKAKPVSSAGELDFSQADFKAWYHWDQENDPKNPAALKVEKALKAKMGAKAYRKFFNDMSDSYSARGHLKAYKECSACGDKGESKSTKTPKTPKVPKELVGNPRHPAWKEFDASWEKTQNAFLKKHGMHLTEKQQQKLDDMYEEAEKKFIEDYKKKTSPKSSEKTTKTEAKSKRLRRELAEAQAEESRSAVKSATRKSEAAFEKAGVSRKDVSAFMKSSPRKWTYDREEGVYKTMVMPDGKGRARGAYKMSVAAAIKKFQKENSTQSK